MRIPTSRALGVPVERLAADLDLGRARDATTELMVRVALALAAGGSREGHRAATKERMLRAFALAATPTPASPDAGSRDTLTPTADVYTAEVVLPDGGRVLMADIEHIDAERITDISRGLYLPMMQEFARPDEQA